MSGGHDRDDEARARQIVAHVTGARVYATDLHGAPPRTLDARLEYDDGRTGWMEVTSVGHEWEYRLAAQLAHDNNRWPMPGRWAWIITFEHPRELRRIRRIYDKVVLLCEAHDVGTIDRLPEYLVDEDPDLEWLFTDSSTQFFGVVLPPGARDESGFIRVNMASNVSSWGRGRGAIVESLNIALQQPLLATHIDKLKVADGDERHLFLHVTQEGLGEGAYYELIHHELGEPESLPPTHPPALPDEVTHLWMFTGWGKRVTSWTRDTGWTHPRHAD